MFGEAIIARSISAARIKDSYGNVWQYLSRSDRHSKIACWAILFDLLRACPLLHSQVAAGKVAFGINHEMRDYQQDRKKKLDLVLCRSGGVQPPGADFAAFGKDCGVVLDVSELEALQELPPLHRAPVSNVLVALEAKACMTEHGKALPRLHDELASSYQTILGDTVGAIAAGFVMINCADTFISSDRNRKRLRSGNVTINSHAQPAVSQKTLDGMMKIRRRTHERESGFDALGIMMIDCRNDRSDVVIDVEGTALLSDIVRYEPFINRIAHLYAAKFAAL
ncbi:MAG TPA: hypothetical protein VHE61_20995 [Opitutaceae bacterium]|nr:hypothetical protein [Opitutaceae bacterium]